MTILDPVIEYSVFGGNCWYECSGSGGKCDFCGPNGYCCSPTQLSINGDCPNDIVRRYESAFQGNGHECIAPVNGNHLQYDFVAKILRNSGFHNFWDLTSRNFGLTNKNFLLKMTFSVFTRFFYFLPFGILYVGTDTRFSGSIGNFPGDSGRSDPVFSGSTGKHAGGCPVPVGYISFALNRHNFGFYDTMTSHF